MGDELVLRAVVFDYGMVLTGPPDGAAHDAMVRITGLPVEEFESSTGLTVMLTMRAS